MEVAVVVGLFLIWEVGELGDPGVVPQPQLTLNSAVEEGYPWVGWQAGEGKSPVYQWMSLHLVAQEGYPWVEWEGGMNSCCSAQLSPV